MADLQLTNCTT